MSIHNIKKPYLLLIGDTENPRNAKDSIRPTRLGTRCLSGQLRFGNEAVDLGFLRLSPEEARAAGAQTLVVGIARRVDSCQAAGARLCSAL